MTELKQTNKKVAPVLRKKPELDPFVASMLPESDKRAASFMGVSMLVALLLGFLTLLYKETYDEALYTQDGSEDLIATLKIDEKKEEKKEEKKPEPKKAGAAGKAKGKGEPKAPTSRGVLKLLQAKSSAPTHDAYRFMDKNFARDLNKVMEKVGGLTTTGQTELGTRRGAADGGFNEGYGEGGAGGLGDVIGGLMGGSGGGIRTGSKGMKGPSQRDIDIGSGDGSRSKADIMAVVNARLPSLKHTYNRFLKQKPGFSGKVTLRFTISAGGDIISISIMSSTTGFPEFDSTIKDAVSKWKWKAIKSGNTTVTIPFNFTE